MAKRFIDTSLFNKRWFREFPPKMKLFYLYMLTQCDHAGMYDVDLELASFQTGMPVKQEDVDKYLKEHIEKIKEDKWFLRKFVDFQYGILNPNVKAHYSVMKILDKYKCLQTVPNSLSTVKNKNKDKEFNKDMDIKLLERSEKTKNNMENRRIKFLNKVNSEYAGDYDKDMRIDFFDYWTESDNNNMRFEKEKVFDIGKRLSRWSKNDFNTKKNPTNFQLDSTGKFYIGFCQKCSDNQSYSEKEILGDSRCCKAKLVPIRESK